MNASAASSPYLNLLHHVLHPKQALGDFGYEKNHFWKWHFDNSLTRSSTQLIPWGFWTFDIYFSNFRHMVNEYQNKKMILISIVYFSVVYSLGIMFPFFGHFIVTLQAARTKIVNYLGDVTLNSISAPSQRSCNSGGNLILTY